MPVPREDCGCLVHRELWQVHGQQVPRPPTTGTRPHAHCCSNTDGLPPPPPISRAVLSPAVPPSSPCRSPGRRPECSRSIPPTWSKEHCSGPGLRPQHSEHHGACPALPLPTPAASRGPGLTPFSILPAVPGGQAQPLAPPRDRVVDTMQGRPSAPSNGQGSVPGQPAVNTQKRIS